MVGIFPDEINRAPPPIENLIQVGKKIKKPACQALEFSEFQFGPRMQVLPNKTDS
jgi:hypothetical protein